VSSVGNTSGAAGSAASGPKGTSIWSATTNKPSGKTTGPDDLGKDDFMKLLLAQLKQQDPLKPMDDQQFIAQTAQFNSLEQMQTLNKTLTAVLDSQQLTEASGLIGKTIAAAGSDGKAVTGAVTGVSMVKGVAQLHIGDKTVALDKVTKVASDATSLPPDDPTVEDKDA
jgi:flagellar basal-body rod modification protein FlgD